MGLETLRLTLRLKHAKKTRLRLYCLSLVFILCPSLCLVFALEPRFALWFGHYLLELGLLVYFLDVCMDGIQKLFKSRIFIQMVCFNDS